MQVWPIVLRPKKDELLSSWLIRSSIAVGNEPTGLVSTIWSDWRPWIVDIDRSVHKKRLKKLVKFTGLRLSDFEDMTLRPSIEFITNNKNLNVNSAWDWVIPTGNRNRTRTNGLHFCPLCLAENPVYFRKSWRFSWNICCERHNVRLISNCPSCNAAISPHLATYKRSELSRCFICGFELEKSSYVMVDPRAYWLQRIMNEALHENLDGIDWKIDCGSDLFEIVHFLMMFFLNSARGLRAYKNLHKVLMINQKELRRHPATGVRIEGRSVVERENMMRAVAQLIKRPVDEVVRLLVKCGISQQMFMIRETESKIIHDIKEQLAFNKKTPFNSKPRSILFRPRTKKEVERMMQEIERFL